LSQHASSPPPDEPAARLTPYELVFGDIHFEQRIFPAIQQEADAQAVEPALRDRFGFLSVVGDTLREVVPDEAGPDALEQYRTMLFHAFNFQRAGKRVYLLDPAVARYVVEAAPSPGDWELRLPYPSLYLQLPPNLFWASVSPEMPPEPVDGVFVTAAPGRDPLGGPSQRLEVMLVLGIRRNRAGFSVIAFDTETGPGIARVWAETPGRDGKDFDNILPGGEIDGLYSILTTAEALKLLARSLWHVDRNPDVVVLRSAAEAPADTRPGAPPLSRLVYYRVSLGGDSVPAVDAAE
jgi:hypothetical protein